MIVGSGTALADDPQLTVRLVEGPHPMRVILDGRARISANAKVFTDPSAPTLHVTCSPGRPSWAPHVEPWCLPAAPSGEGVDLDALLAGLGARGMMRILVEGGSQVITAFLRRGLVDRIIVSVAPMILGRGIDAVADLGIDRLDHALRFTRERVFSLGDDVLIELVPLRDPGPTS